MDFFYIFLHAGYVISLIELCDYFSRLLAYGTEVNHILIIKLFDGLSV